MRTSRASLRYAASTSASNVSASTSTVSLTRGPTNRSLASSPSSERSPSSVEGSGSATGPGPMKSAGSSGVSVVFTKRGAYRRSDTTPRPSKHRALRGVLCHPWRTARVRAVMSHRCASIGRLFRTRQKGGAAWRSSARAAELLKCSFCGKSQKQVRKLIAGPGVYICDECIDLCNEIIDDEVETATAETPFESVPKPREIFAFLDDYIIDQDRTKTILSVAVYNHYKRMRLEPAGPGAAEGRGDRQVQHPADRPHRLRQDDDGPDAGAHAQRALSPSPTPRRSPRPATWARTSRTSCSSCCRPPIST